MVDVGVDEKALTHLVEKVLVADAHAPVTLALEKAGVRTASDLVSLKLDPYVPLKYDRAVEGGNKVEKNIPLLQAEMRQIIGIQEYIQYYSKNVSHKFFESLDDWEELTAKNFISFRINIAPFLPPDVTPPAVVTQPSPATSNLCDWEKGVKPDMSIFRELKNVKEWDQWDTQFRADVSTQGLSSVLDSNFRPQTFKDKVLFHEQQQYLYAVFVRILKTDEGKAIARKYKSTFDAQGIYRELQEYITTACIVNGSWNGMTEQSPRKAVKCSAVKCSVYMSDLAINDGEDDVLQFSGENEADYNIDSDPMTLMANAHGRRELSANRVLMHSEQWKGMSPNGQEIWDQYSDEDKAVVLSKPATVVMRPNQPSNERELSKPATVVMRRDQLSNEREPSSHKRAPSKLSKDRQVNAHITYAVDKCHMDKPRSLIDRGANGGMAGADEWEMLPHVHWTHVHWARDSDWDPAIFNHEFGDNDDEWDDPVMDHRDLLDKVGNYRNRQGVDAGEVHSSHQIEVTISRLHFQARQVRPGEQDWETLCRLFGWAKHYKDAYGVS